MQTPAEVATVDLCSMRVYLVSFSLLASAVASTSAATALSALRFLPPEISHSVSVVAGREGRPEPERWHILVQDSGAENGLREVVVGNGRRLANRTVSQFAEKLTPADIFGPDTARVDSDQAATTALRYGAANNASISMLHYDLRKGSDGALVWTVTCIDLAGIEIGKLVISATKGTVLLHQGFPTEPGSEKPVAEAPPAPLKAPPTSSEPAPASAPTATPSPSGSTADSSVPIAPGQATTTQGQPNARKSSSKTKAATPLPVTATPKANLFKRLFGGGNPR